MTVLLVALGSAPGAALRFYLAGRLDGRVPLGTLAVNVIGSFLLGVFSARSLDGHAWAVLATGFCGGLTTYSAFAVQVVRLRLLTLRAVGYVVATIVGALAAVTLGFALGS
ncbi:MAG: CrcB family protein [Nocardioides sp.]